VILLWMNGGPSQLDTFDPKPNSKNGGIFKPIKTSISGTFLNIYPAGVGLTYLLTTEVAFSLWFFFVLERMQQIVFAYYGWTALGMSATDFVQFQQVGAVIGLLVIVAWAAKSHWRKVIDKAIGRLQEVGDEDEALPYPLAFWGLAGGECVFSGLVSDAGSFVAAGGDFHCHGSRLLFGGSMDCQQWRVGDGSDAHFTPRPCLGTVRLAPLFAPRHPCLLPAPESLHLRPSGDPHAFSAQCFENH